MKKETWIRLNILIGLVLILIVILLFYAYSAFGWEEIAIWDHHDWSSSSEISVIPYSKWDSQKGSNYGYIYDYQPHYNRIPPASRELERQELRREDWWGDDYKEWLEDQGVDKGMMMGW